MRPEYGECDLHIGDSVQIHPGLDVWMRGARYGVVHRIQGDMYAIRMHHPAIRRLVWTTKDRLQLIRKGTGV